MGEMFEKFSEISTTTPEVKPFANNWEVVDVMKLIEPILSFSKKISVSFNLKSGWIPMIKLTSNYLR